MHRGTIGHVLSWGPVRSMERLICWSPSSGKHPCTSCPNICSSSHRKFNFWNRLLYRLWFNLWRMSKEFGFDLRKYPNYKDTGFGLTFLPAHPSIPAQQPIKYKLKDCSIHLLCIGIMFYSICCIFIVHRLCPYFFHFSSFEYHSENSLYSIVCSTKTQKTWICVTASICVHIHCSTMPIR